MTHVLSRRRWLAGMVALGVSGLGVFSLVSAQPASMLAQARRRPDVVYVPSPNPVVHRMLEIANVSSFDLVYDLGSGDGRIPITAAQRFGARAIGIDINPDRILQARRNAREARVEDKVRFIEGDLFEADIGEATVVTLYLLNSLNARLQPKLLRELRPGTRVVSHAFDMAGWPAERMDVVRGSPVYLWRIPPRA